MRSASLSHLKKRWSDSLFGEAEFTRFFDRPRKQHRGPALRLMILSVSAGSGHVRAAEAVKAHAHAHFPSIRVQHCDVMQLVPRAFRKIYTDWYIALASYLPEAWGWLYRKTDQQSAGSWLDAARRFLQQRCAGSLMAEIDRFAPDAILCTHFLPAELLSAAVQRGRLHCPVWIQVTDFDLHHMWVHEHIAGYFVANDELRYRLQAYGVPSERIIVSGIPVMPGFSAPPSRAISAARFSLDAQRMTILLMGGGAGVGNMDAMTSRLLALDPTMQLIVLAGKNSALLESLQSLSATYPGRLLAMGFTQEVHALMACTDLVITKPGGLSTSECLVMGLPMLLVNPIPGQEERNAAFLLQEGVAVRADDPATLAYRLQDLLHHPARLITMRERAQALAKPHAAAVVFDTVLRLNATIPTRP